MPFIYIPSRITVEIPALSDLVSFLREVDKRDQMHLKAEIDAATATLKASDVELQTGIEKAKDT